MASIQEKISKVSKELGDKIIEFDWDESQIMSLERQDLFELFPGDKNLFTRKRVFGLIQGAKKSAVQMDSTSTRLSSTPQSSVVSSDSSFEGGSDDTDLSSATPKHFKLAAKKKFCIEKPNFQLYSDEELKAVEGKESMSPSLQNRLVQSTVANMISGTHQLSTPRYPSFQELAEAARHLCEIYPALNFETLRNKMKRRLQNVRPRRTIQGPKPSRSKYYKQQLQADPINNFTGNDTIEDMMGECEEIARDTEMLVKNVQSVMSESRACATSNQKNMTSNRHQENLMREEGKKKPNQDNVNYYMDLLFENRREAIMTEPLFNRHKFLKEKYPSMSNPMQMIQEVRRVLDFTNKDFVKNTLERLEKLIDSLMYYIFSKPELLSSIIIHCPIGCSRDTKLVHILSVVDVLFEKKRKNKDNKCGNKKKINVIQTFENTQDPEQLRKMHPNNGMPGLLIERPTGKSIILIGNQVFTMVDDIKNGFLAFLSLYFVLDVEYQSEYALAFTIMHRLLFLDNRCEENILNDHDET